MRRCVKTVCQAILILVIAPCATAQTAEDSGWVIAAYLGGAHTSPSDLTISQPAFGTNITFERAEFKLRSRLYAFGEYKFTRSNQRGKVSAGNAETLLRTHHGVFGLSYHF